MLLISFSRSALFVTKPLFFPLGFTARTLHSWVMNLRRKTWSITYGADLDSVSKRYTQGGPQWPRILQLLSVMIRFSAWDTYLLMVPQGKTLIADRAPSSFLRNSRISKTKLYCQFENDQEDWKTDLTFSNLIGEESLSYNVTQSPISTVLVSIAKNKKYTPCNHLPISHQGEVVQHFDFNQPRVLYSFGYGHLGTKLSRHQEVDTPPTISPPRS